MSHAASGGVAPNRILLVEDNPADALLVEELLRETGEPFALTVVDRRTAALEHLAGAAVDVILLDLSLPDSQGFETLVALRETSPGVPVVVLSGRNDMATAIAAVQEGAQDYLMKGQVTAPFLGRVVLYAMERHRLHATLRDLSLTDELTGLYNRRGFLTLGAQAMLRAERQRSGVLVAFADLDGLKAVNDTRGHAEGDRLIREAGTVLRRVFRSVDLIARVGGDEFAILLHDTAPAQRRRVVERVEAELAACRRRAPEALAPSLSLGFAWTDGDARVSLERLILEADEAMYRVKRRRKQVKEIG